MIANERQYRITRQWVKNFEQTWADRFERLDTVLAELMESEETDDDGN